MVSWFGLFWVFLIIVGLQPLVRQYLLSSRRTRLIRTLEKRRGSRVIALIHRQETMAVLGFPLVRFIDIEDSEELLRAVQLTDDQMPIDLILHTPGGLVLAAEMIAHALIAHTAPVTVFVPHYAMSGGTLLALAANQIVMAPHAVLGPLDPQIGQWPAASILRAVEKKTAANHSIHDETLIMADVAGKAMDQVRGYARQLLIARGWMTEAAEQLSLALTEGRWTHDYPITVEEARGLGLHVSSEMPDEIYEFMRLFPQVAVRRPSVQYVQMPYHSQPAKAAKH
ncbi:MAG: ATP-dependent Clp protease proteolytic subunit [Candidatus Binataceae bacterium]|nr:ATP-dependent Clp protease proteolytic subunit [Candidatus Binataceae bacterium]